MWHYQPDETDITADRNSGTNTGGNAANEQPALTLHIKTQRLCRFFAQRECIEKAAAA